MERTRLVRRSRLEIGSSVKLRDVEERPGAKQRGREGSEVIYLYDQREAMAGLTFLIHLPQGVDPLPRWESWLLLAGGCSLQPLGARLAGSRVGL